MAIEVSDYDLEHMLMSALRYSFGRMTYITSMCAGHLCDYVPLLHPRTQKKFINELEKLLAHEDPGMDCDEVEWRCALAFLKEKYEEVNDA